MFAFHIPSKINQLKLWDISTVIDSNCHPVFVNQCHMFFFARKELHVNIKTCVNNGQQITCNND